MFDRMKNYSCALLWTILPALALLSAETWARRSEDRRVNGAKDYLESLAENVQILEGRMYSLREADGGDERELRRYYEGVKEAYLMQSVRAGAGKITKALDNYMDKVEKAFRQAQGLPHVTYSTATTSRCFQDQGLKSLGNSVDDVEDSLKSALNSPSASSSGSRFSSRYIDVTTGSRLSDAADSLSRLLRNDPEDILQACVESKLYNDDKIVFEKTLETLHKAKEDLNADLANLSQENRFVMVPDPLSTRLSAYQVAQILRSGALNSILSRLRRNPNGAMMEQDVWDQIVPTCEKEKSVIEDKARPWQYAKQIGKQILNDGICSYLPSYGAAKWNMSKAQNTINFARALDASGLVHCDQGTLDALSLARSPQADLKRMNFDVLKNQPYIEKIFTLLPYQNPLGAMVEVPNGGGVMNNLGWYGNTLPPLNGSAPGGGSVFSAISGTGNGTLNAMTNTRNPAATSVVSAGVTQASTGSRLAPSRGRGMVENLGEAVGNEMAHQVKGAAELIRMGGSGAQVASSVLRRGAVDANNYVSQVNSAQSTQGPQGVRRERSRMAVAFKEAAQKLAMATGSTQAVNQLKGAIGATRGDANSSVFGNSSSTDSATVSQLSKTIEVNRQQKNTNMVAAQAIQKSVELAVAKSAEYVDKMRKLAVQYKEEIIKAEGQVYDAKPKDQVNIGYSLNAKLEKIVKDIAPLYAAYNALGSTINEGYMMMTRLYGSVGTTAPYVAGVTQIPGFGNIPSGFPTGFANPTTPSGGSNGTSVFSSSSAGTALLNFFDLGRGLKALVGIPEAVAEAKLEEETAWAQQWQQFTQDYAAYAEARQKSLRAENEKVMQMWTNTFNSKDLKGVELSSDQIQANQIFVQSLNTESESLIKHMSTKGNRKVAEVEKDIKVAADAGAELQKNLEEANLKFLKNYPVTSDDHLNGWKRAVTTLILEAGQE